MRGLARIASSSYRRGSKTVSRSSSRPSVVLESARLVSSRVCLFARSKSGGSDRRLGPERCVCRSCRGRFFFRRRFVFFQSIARGPRRPSDPRQNAKRRGRRRRSAMRTARRRRLPTRVCRTAHAIANRAASRCFAAEQRSFAEPHQRSACGMPTCSGRRDTGPFSTDLCLEASTHFDVDARGGRLQPRRARRARAGRPGRRAGLARECSRRSTLRIVVLQDLGTAGARMCREVSTTARGKSRRVRIGADRHAGAGAGVDERAGDDASRARRASFGHRQGHRRTSDAVSGLFGVSTQMQMAQFALAAAERRREPYRPYPRVHQPHPVVGRRTRARALRHFTGRRTPARRGRRR